MLTLVAAIALFVAVCVVPGRGLVAAAVEDAPAVERVLLAPVLGFALVAFAAHVLALVPLEMVDAAVPPAPRVLAAAAAVALLSRRARPAVPATGGARREPAVVAGFAALVAGLALVAYDRELFGFTCTYRAVAVAAQVPVGSFWEHTGFPRALLLDSENDMHGVVALLSLFPSLLGFAGDRVSFAAVHGLTVAGTYVIARRLPVGPVAAGVAAVAAGAHPLLWTAAVNDVNAVALFASVAAWAAALALGPSRAAATTVGLAAALAVGAWHPALLGVPALLAAYLLRLPAERRAGAARASLLALTVGGLPWALRHWAAFGSPFTLETFRENAATVHAAGGFAYHGLLNAPFLERVVRTPMNGYPVFVELPLALLRASGSVLLALALLGAGLALARRAATAVALAGYALVLVLPMLVQENWLEPEKMQIPLVAFVPFLAAVAYGVEALRARRGRALARTLIAWASLVVLLHGAAWAVRGLDVPVDERFVERWPHLRAERPEELAELRRAATAVRPWPTLRVGAPGDRDLATRLAVLADALARPRFVERAPSAREAVVWMAMPRAYELFLRQAGHDGAGAPPPPDAGRWVELDLARPLVPGSAPSVRALDAPPEPFARPRGIAVHRRLALPWRPEPADVGIFQAPAPPHDVWVVVVNPSPDMLAELRESLPERADLLDGPAPPPPATGVPHRLDGELLRLGLPPGARLVVVDVPSIEPSRVYAWWLDGAEGGGGLRGDPARLVHF